MAPAFRGIFVVSWSQTEADGQRMPPVALVRVGTGWRWSGQAVRIDQPGLAPLSNHPDNDPELGRRAARMVRRLIGAAIARDERIPDEDVAPESEQDFLLTDGRKTWSATIIPVPDSAARLVMFVGDMPPADQDLWVVRCHLDPRKLQPSPDQQGGVICFTPGTRLATPSGPRAIETLRPGDLVETADCGMQPILWAGQRRMSGARLYAMPQLRPVRIRAQGLGHNRPQADLLVSPQHRMLVQGQAARALFGTPEVLVRAQDLIDDHRVMVDTQLREVTYVHVLLDSHQIVFANGLPTESFHPLSAALETLDPQQREGLMALLPDPAGYGAYARRNLSASEAAIWRHELG